ncbi:MAG: bifunctional DNA-formamidopyrimidine glycosylase/DNA-(apurinic or apyrimidinic site) lyase [Gemmatimonadetes bacterium]|nr:bifunctional DNA-formamidopyrimidine glycosylase/DNA-(apurinic or apyrimidinic site) lyase [Gemmatimonadota bacterium]
MPELPEVETIVRQLGRHLAGRRIERAEVLRENVVRGSVRRFERALAGTTVTQVGRRGKFIVARLADGRVWLTHLRMSGKYQLANPSAGGTDCERPARRVAEAPPPIYARAIFRLDDGTSLFYVDPRTLGEMVVLPAAEWRRREAMLGPEPLEPSFTPWALQDLLAGSRRPVKEFLLDQTKIAGLGNIYASEALWRARVSPRRRARNVGPVRAARLHRAIVEVLGEAIGMSGTSLGATYQDWADGAGERGRFYDFLAVYDREGEPCRSCGNPIRRIVQGQRSTYFCPGCQR